MEEASTIFIPLLNPNEREVSISAIHITGGQYVQTGQPICSIENTKSTADIEADRNGYILHLQFKEGDTASAGDILCYIADNPNWTPESFDKSITRRMTGTVLPDFDDKIPQGLRITTPALETARENGINLNILPKDQLITREFLIDFFQISQGSQEKFNQGMDLISQLNIPEGERSKTIVIYGGGGLGKTIIELIQSIGEYLIIGIIDDGIEPGIRILNIPVLGSSKHLEELKKKGIYQAVNAVGGIGDVIIRSKVFETLNKADFSLPSVIHPTAIIEQSAIIESGVQVFANSYIGTEVRIGFGCLINTGSIISHDCVLGDQVNISPGTILAGGVKVGNQALIGMGVTVNLGVLIGESARIGNGATIKGDVPPKTIVRAGTRWPAG